MSDISVVLLQDKDEQEHLYKRSVCPEGKVERKDVLVLVRHKYLNKKLTGLKTSI